MTPIKRRKRQKFVYCFSQAIIDCHHYTMSEVSGDSNDAMKFLHAKIQ